MSLFRLTLLLLFLLSPLTNFSQTKIIEYFILEGKINVDSGTVYLIPTIPPDSVDSSLVLNNFSTKIIKGEFQIKGLLKYPYPFNLKYCNGDSCKYVSDFFVIENGVQKAAFNLNNTTPVVNNQAMENFYNSGNLKISNRIKRDSLWFQLFLDSLHNQYKNNKVMPDSLEKVIVGIRANLKERNRDFIYNLCDYENDSFYSFWCLYINFYFYGNRYYYEYLFSRFSNRLKENDAGKKFQIELNDANLAGIDKRFPTFFIYKNLKTKQYEEINMNSNNKYTLIDFWHSGCGIFIEQMLKYKDTYSKYSTKRFQIITISRDKTDQLEYLERLRKKYQFSWLEYLDENRIISEKINIVVDPTNFLIDNLGRIIKKDIRPDELEVFLKDNLK